MNESRPIKSKQRAELNSALCASCVQAECNLQLGEQWRKVPDDILSYLGVGLNLSARRLPPSLLRPCCVALSSDFVEGTFISFPESTA